jgi:hypothetical protein
MFMVQHHSLKNKLNVSAQNSIVRFYIKIRSLLSKEYYYTINTVVFEGALINSESQNKMSWP